MCTVSFLPDEHGFQLAMNRDEAHARPPELPPRIRSAGALTAVYPSEAGGGAWVAVNSAGAALALLNWNEPAPDTGERQRSRGLVIPVLTEFHSGDRADVALRQIPFADMRPFRLLGIFATELQVWEWHSDGRTIGREHWPWQERHWFSSSYDEPGVQRSRATACARFSKVDFDRPEQLHRDHWPEPGAYSICMHRVDAASRSFTHILVDRERSRLCYRPGSPCAPSVTLEMALPRLRSPQSTAS